MGVVKIWNTMEAAEDARESSNSEIHSSSLTVDHSLSLLEMTPHFIELCKDLFKKWVELDNSNFSAETISSGITNLYFTVYGRADLPDEDDARRMHRCSLLPREDDQEDIEALERSIRARYAKSSHTEYDEETTDVEQRALLPSVRDPKLWMVRCLTGREREAAVCLMQKYTDKGSKLKIRSAIALDHLKNYIYIEADKKAHVREACKGMRSLFSNKVMLVPIKEMTDVLSVESKTVDLFEDTWVRMEIGTYKGDFAKRVTMKLIPRIDLQALTNKLKNAYSCRGHHPYLTHRNWPEEHCCCLYQCSLQVL
ncbi:hypothetical protein F0562_006935 [Nyssa sinensis]|uniref:NusG-like N-terminal domain-containing protein n=1 Tax=Nyssa sinensis TaxID=561372 RepID=A0A5J5A710_9ASTE|nr:hypothetical protein F0562_006935 [Nyssa sinensis]